MSISYDLKWKDWIWSNDFKLWQQILKEFWGKNRVFNKKKNRREPETCKGAWSQFSNLSNIIKRTFNPCIDVSCVFRNHQILLFESPPKSSFVSLKNSARYSLHAITLENFPYKQRLHITRVRAFGHKTSQLWLHVPSITDLPALSTSQQTLLNKYNL